MDPITLGILGMLVLTVFLVSGMRIAYATALCGFAGLWLLRGYKPAAGLSGLLPFAETAHYTLLVLPLFILMGYFTFYAGITRDIFWTARQWFGKLPGGMAIATIFGAAGFAAASGASTASAAVMGRIAFPELKRLGYDDKVSAGCIAAGGTMATMIPPSVLMVIYGFIAEESIGAMLLAGFLPGLLEAFSYALMLIIRFKINPSLGPPLQNITWRDRFVSLKGTWGILTIILLIMGSMYTGLATPTEAAGVGALGAMVMALARKMSWMQFKESFLETGRTTALIFGIVVGVLIFVKFIGFTGMPNALSNWIVDLPVHPLVVLACILLLYLILGMFLDAIGMLLLTIPILLPAVRELGIHPIVFGVLVIRMMEVGLITPPMGLNVYVLKGVAPNVKMGDIFRGCGWFVFVDIINVAILIAFPGIILFLPETMIQ